MTFNDDHLEIGTFCPRVLNTNKSSQVFKLFFLLFLLLLMLKTYDDDIIVVDIIRTLRNIVHIQKIDFESLCRYYVSV